MHRTPNPLPETSRRRVVDALNASLADGLDLYGQLKVAHWNVRGPLFPSLHPLFESIADALAVQNDAVAERAVTLGGRAYGTARHVAAASRLADYVQETTRDLDHVRLAAERMGTYLEGLRASRRTAEDAGDDDTVDLLTGTIREFEKHAWFLLATIE